VFTTATPKQLVVHVLLSSTDVKCWMLYIFFEFFHVWIGLSLSFKYPHLKKSCASVTKVALD